MNAASSMTTAHETKAQPWQWTVTAATRLPAAPQARWLVVDAGRAWLTRSRAELAGEVDAAEDIWLGAGERLQLPAGSEWVVEGWPSAQLALLAAPPRRRERTGGWLSREWARPASAPEGLCA